MAPPLYRLPRRRLSLVSARNELIVVFQECLLVLANVLSLSL
jgi:hypothetical protein